MADGGAEEEQVEKWVKYYSSFHEILLVGEGDFSFSLCLAKSFGSASNIVASSLDSYDDLINKYRNAKSNLELLKNLGASLLHGLDATKMKFHNDLLMRKFDRIIFNFPHAGFHGKEDGIHLIGMHRKLVFGFLGNARGMLRADGEIHVNHKTTAPFCHWNLHELGIRNSLMLIECVDFRIEEYPGYSNKRGASPRCDDSFPLGECSTFKFIVSPAVKNGKAGNLDLARGTSQALQLIPNPVHLLQKQPISFNLLHPQMISGGRIDNTLEHTGLPLRSHLRNECFRIFGKYLHHAEETFGRTDYDVSHSVREALRLGYKSYMTGDSGRCLSGYISMLQELQHQSILRSTWLRNRLAEVCDLQL
ncbi:uncharacterized protein At4g26485 [Coffea arabica]|uniref:Uncharacterized protein At4g26485 n=1 Tax=Coffea arabica TaxID=13443 RepID=A0A6P6SC62_COFAR|nr:uncharacterized protein At4g26485-like [Coffea arabica]